MNSSSDAHINARLFIGCLVNGEVRMHLNASEKWNQAKLHIQGESTAIEKVPFNKNDYIGFFSQKNSLSMIEIRDAEKMVRQRLLEVCPDLDIEKLKITLFPLVFIT